MKVQHWRDRFRIVFVSCLVGVVTGCLTTPQGSGGSGGDANVPDTVPDFEGASFTNPTIIDNPFLPLVAGTTFNYQGETEEGTETIVYETLNDTREVNGVTSRVVRDRVYVDGLLVEDTYDWFAQDDEGNVWYMGEEVDDYNYDEQGNLIDITHSGVWEAGKDVVNVGSLARAGIIMKANPAVGDIYHQEWYAGEAEDMGEVVAVDVIVTLADGTSYSCLQIRDFSSLDLTANENKYYAPGIGLVREEVVGGEDRIELIDAE